ncbi:MAG: mercury transporter [Bauldia sp.]
MIIRHIAAAATLAVVLSSGVAHAESRTVVLRVENATCALCGPIVKMTLQGVSGVKAVGLKEADAFSGAVATVEFDDAVTDVQALITATTNAGYPSRLSD